MFKMEKNFYFANETIETLELPFFEHIEELRQRIFLVLTIILLLTCISFIEVKNLVEILELPISNVKFFQLRLKKIKISTRKKKCQYCQSRVNHEAIVCRYCQRDIKDI